MAKPLTDRIEHVVVLMLENRSFDNVLGGLYPDRTKQGRYRGLWGKETNPLDPTKSGGASVTVFQGPAAQSTWIMPYPDPGELYSDMVQQIFGSNASVLPSGVLPPMSGFAWNYSGQAWSTSGPGWPSVPPVPRNIMQYYSAATMPATFGLAQAFAVCDCWFAAAPVQTLANRVLAHCATPGALASNSQMSRINNPDYFFDDIPLFVFNTTIFQLLDNANPGGVAPDCSNSPTPVKPLNWKVYHHDAPLSAFCFYVWENWCYDYDYGGNVWGFENNSALDPGFEHDVANGLLPTYSFIEPRYADNTTDPGIVNSNHPGGAGFDPEDPNGASLPPPVDVLDGERLLCEVYSILRKYPDVFAKTLLIVTYDEHGGVFDHVGPPGAASPFVPPVTNFNYDRYGVRVPVLLINPFITPGTVYPANQDRTKPIPSPFFDHTSILSTLIAQFTPYQKGILTPREAAAPPITGLISGTSYAPPACPTIPSGPTPRPAIARPPLPPGARIPGPPHPLAGPLRVLYRRMERSRRRRR